MVAPLVLTSKDPTPTKTIVIRLRLGPRAKRASPHLRAPLSDPNHANQALLQDLQP